MGTGPAAAAAEAVVTTWLLVVLPLVLPLRRAAVRVTRRGASCCCATCGWEVLEAGVALLQLKVQLRLPSAAVRRATLDSMGAILCAALPLAAVTFPADFLTAVQGGAGVTGVSSGAGAGAGAGPCISLAGVRAVLSAEGAAGDDEPTASGGGAAATRGHEETLELVMRVLGGSDPEPGEAWGLVRRCWRDPVVAGFGAKLERLVAVMRALPAPEEARAAVAAAAAAASDAEASAPA